MYLCDLHCTHWLIRVCLCVTHATSVHVFTELHYYSKFIDLKYNYVWLAVPLTVYRFIYLRSKHPHILVYTFSAYPNEGLKKIKISISDKFPAFYNHKYTQKKVTLTNTYYMNTQAKNVKPCYHRKSSLVVLQFIKTSKMTFIVMHLQSKSTGPRNGNEINVNTALVFFFFQDNWNMYYRKDKILISGFLLLKFKCNVLLAISLEFIVKFTSNF